MPRSAAERAALRRLQAIADRAAPAVRLQIERALKQLRDSVRIGDLERALGLHDSFAIHSIGAQLPITLRPALAQLQRVFLQATQAAQALLPQTATISLRFDMVSQYAVAAAKSEAAQLVTGITAETRQAIRKVVTRSFEEGIPPRDAARMIQPLVGLTERQALAVANQHLAMVKQGRSLAETLARTRKYADRLRKQRALMIARTETIGASTRGLIAGWKEAQMRGLLSANAFKVWITTPDDRLCRWCRRMDGVKVRVSELFFGARRPVMGPPLHPNCRCTLGIEFAAARRVA